MQNTQLRKLHVRKYFLKIGYATLNWFCSPLGIKYKYNLKRVPGKWVYALLFFLACLVQLPLKAQDPIFTQAFLSPINLNPAATGTGEHDLRISAIYRRQWWRVPSNMNSMAFSIDKYLPQLSSGVGFLVTHSSEGYLNKNSVYGTYAYSVCGGTGSAAENAGPPKWFWTGGFQFGFAQTRVDFSKFVFADELDVNGIIPGYISSADPPVNSGRIFPDFGAGTFFNYNLSANRRLLAGFSAHHINRPDESLISTSDTVRSQLPVLWSGNLLYTYSIPEQPWTVSIGAIYYRQANNKNYQIGVEVTHNDYNVSLGMWYRGSANFRDMNTIGFTLSFNLSGGDISNKMHIGLGHDSQVGSNDYSYTGGSSEFGMVWDHNTYKQQTDDPCKPKINIWECPGAVR